MIKHWLSKSLRQNKTWYSKKDYPPKKRKPWLAGSFAEREELPDELLGDPRDDPDSPLPIPPQEDDLGPCAGARNLWVLANPPSIDCDVSSGFTLIISPDFKCIDIQQLNKFDGPTISDPPKELERGCDDKPFITIAVTDCLCGGFATIDIFTENCAIDCGPAVLEGPDEISTSTTAQLFFNQAVGTVVWSTNTQGATVDQSGLVTASAACGMVTVNAETSCCGNFQHKLRVIDAGYWRTLTLCIKEEDHTPYPCTEKTGADTQTYWVGKCGGITSCGTPPASCIIPGCDPSERKSAWKETQIWECVP